MPYLRKNIPTRDMVISTYRYIESGKHEGRLIKIDTPEEIIDFIEIGKLRVTRGKTYRVLSLKGVYYPEAKLVYLMAKGYYPDNALIHLDGDLLNTRIENLKISSHRAQPHIDSESGIVGITRIKSGQHINRWRVTKSEYTYIEKPKAGKKTRGWRNRDIDVFTKTKQVHIGYTDTLEQAKQMLKDYNNNHMPHLINKTDAVMQERLDAIKARGVRWYIGQLWDNKKISIRTIDELEAFFGVEAVLTRPATAEEWEDYGLEAFFGVEAILD